ncbi:myb family transcription factor phl7 [Nicotiana attenuata]|uniref:Myb family transcription factor phl7 n=2 Tax=Nicotiana attenuata TaxID=49451 RepID=A0A314KT66_NICAT|nr:myb family transcription factor phl7 [Nicotiana attenuata]
MPGKFKELLSSNMGSNRSDCSSKERLKWTQQLHDLFEKAVTQLGGPERATPKGILKVMGIEGLTIFHVKSHLQKYRMSKFVREDPVIGKFERRSISEILPNFSATAGAQLHEALQMHMDARRRLSDHLEVQRNLKMKLEAQGRFLDGIMEERKARASSSRLSCKSYSYSPLSLPSLCDELSESNVKELESDSEVDRNEIRSVDPECQARKRTLIHEDVILSHRYNSNVAYSSLTSGAQNHPYSSPHELPWSTLASYDSLV